MRKLLSLILFSSLIFYATSSEQEDEQDEFDNTLEAVHIERGAAVWGAKAPDYSLASTNPGTTVFIRSVVFVDNKTTAYYEFDMIRVKLNIMMMIDEANQYLNQLGVGLIVVAILQTNRGDLSLQSFHEYRNARLHKLPEHEFATLISYKYAGGLAYVNGMCSSHSVSLSGFYPNEPRAMGSIFFHEVAHLVGVPHRAVNESIYVPNCQCTPTDSKKEDGCLKIPGFDHDCTVQQLVNMIYKNKCIQKTPQFKESEPVCGNGVLEEGEDCDCGLPGRCADLNCQPHTCRFFMHPCFLALVIVSFAVFCVLATWLIIRRYLPIMLNCFKTYKSKHDRGTSSPYTNGQIQILAASPYQSRKMSHSSFQASGSNTILVSNDSRFATIQRPKVPPPPPPPKTTLQVIAPGGGQQYETTKVFGSYRESFYDDFTDDEFEEPEVPSAYPLPPGVPTCPSYPPNAPINRVTVELQSPRTNSTATTTNSSTSFSF
uniref:Peptidase M12B domain-containing protein n=1 Tax=Caenorhabditis japonica TaxID=281687 RepID=A0A8R1E2L0_CAEJA